MRERWGRSNGGRPGALCAGLLTVALAALPLTARGESTMRLELPTGYGPVAAATYDVAGHRVGPAHLAIEQLPANRVRIVSETGVEGGARAIATATMVRSADGRTLQPLVQTAVSFQPSGEPLGELRVDHAAAVGTCREYENGTWRTTQLALPERDRIVNVPMNLLFAPLVRGEQEHVRFQMFLCRGEPRLLDFDAWVARRESAAEGTTALVEIRYEPDLGAVLKVLARGFVPQLSFWFDPAAPDTWLAHRLPLYTKGPEVAVVREGVAPARLLQSH